MSARKEPSKKEQEAWFQRLLAGERLALARILRWVDDYPQAVRQLVLKCEQEAKIKPVIWGFTGHPGAGKSTLVDAVLSALREKNERVAVLAIDPSSPFTGGAILGDRVRMMRHFADDGVFVRSLATRGAMGGVSRSTFDSVQVLAAAGFDKIIIETVGVGQDEVDVVRLADSTLVVMVPGMGDDVQALKAGLLEIADVFVLNKSDRAGTEELERGLSQMLGLRAHEAEDWLPPIVRTVATENKGIEEILKKLARHAQYLAGPKGQDVVQARKLEVFERLLDLALLERAHKMHAVKIHEAREKVVLSHDEPYEALEKLLALL